MIYEHTGLRWARTTSASFDFPSDVTENYPVRCNGVPYVDSKVMGEQVVLQAHAAGEIDSTIIRPGDVYGPRSRPWTTHQSD